MPEDRDAHLARFSEWLATTLGLQAIAPHVAERALADPLFLNRLVMIRQDRDQVQSVLATTPASLPKWAVPANLRSIARVTTAMGRWARAGFRPVAKDVLAVRVAACRRCPHLAAPGALLQQLAAGKDGTICGLCSCAIEKKAMLPTEACPAIDPERPGHSRWGEPHSA